jgi:NSS family neurotransmitter:Na+ symporter
MSRSKATWLISALILIASMTLVAFFDVLFGLVIMVLTTIMQPLMCLFYFIVIGWLWKRGNKLSDKAHIDSNSWLRYVANYLRYVCPVLLVIVFINIAFLK